MFKHLRRREGIEVFHLAYLEAYLEEKGMTYDEFLSDLIKPKGILEKLLETFKSLFS